MEKPDSKKKLSMILSVVVLTAVGFVLLYLDSGTSGGRIVQPASKTEQVSFVSETPKIEPISEPMPETKTETQAEADRDKININTATISQLDSLPGIGEKLSERIVAYREKTPFKVTYDLKKVPGIGDKIFASLSDLICVE